MTSLQVLLAQLYITHLTPWYEMPLKDMTETPQETKGYGYHSHHKLNVSHFTLVLVLFNSHTNTHTLFLKKFFSQAAQKSTHSLDVHIYCHFHAKNIKSHD